MSYHFKWGYESIATLCYYLFSPYDRINPGLKREILFWSSLQPTFPSLENMSFSHNIWAEESIISVHCFACSKVIWLCINNSHFTISRKLSLNAYVLKEIAYFMKECWIIQILFLIAWYKELVLDKVAEKVCHICPCYFSLLPQLTISSKNVWL